MRPIDADKLINWCNETFKAQTTVAGKEYINAFLQAIVMSETEDVVPRAEVDVLETELSRYTENCKRMVEQAKQEVAREIFDLIDNYIYIVKTTVSFDLDFLITSINELKKKYIGE